MAIINLIPAHILARQLRRHHLRRWLAPLATASIGVAVMLWMTLSQQAEASELEAQTQQLVSQVALSQQQLNQARTKSLQLQEQKRRADALRRKRAWSRVLALIGQSLPKSAWLTSVSTDPTTPSIVRRTQSARIQADQNQKLIEVVTIDAARKLRILGYTAQPGEPHELVGRLKTSGIFESVSLIHSRRQDVFDGSYFQFEVLCAW